MIVVEVAIFSVVVVVEGKLHIGAYIVSSFWLVALESKQPAATTHFL